LTASSAPRPQSPICLKSSTENTSTDALSQGNYGLVRIEINISTYFNI